MLTSAIVHYPCEHSHAPLKPLGFFGRHADECCVFLASRLVIHAHTCLTKWTFHKWKEKVKQMHMVYKSFSHPGVLRCPAFHMQADTQIGVCVCACRLLRHLLNAVLSTSSPFNFIRKPAKRYAEKNRYSSHITLFFLLSVSGLDWCRHSNIPLPLNYGVAANQTRAVTLERQR